MSGKNKTHGFNLLRSRYRAHEYIIAHSSDFPDSQLSKSSGNRNCFLPCAGKGQQRGTLPPLFKHTHTCTHPVFWGMPRVDTHSGQHPPSRVLEPSAVPRSCKVPLCLLNHYRRNYVWYQSIPAIISRTCTCTHTHRKTRCI